LKDITIFYYTELTINLLDQQQYDEFSVQSWREAYIVHYCSSL